MRRAPIVVVAALGVALVGCGDDDPPTEESYCALVATHVDELSAPQVATPADVDRTVELYRELAASAPLAIEPEWQTMVISVETAATVAPDDADSVQRAADAARASRPDADRVLTYTLDLCGITFDEVPSTPPVTVPTT